jgi:perosamine synthetase
MSSDVIPPMRPCIPREDIEQMKNHVERILVSGRLTLGEYTKELEHDFVRLVGVKRAIAVNSGTSALEIAFRAQSLRRGDEVIVPTNTFAATGAAVVYAGGKPLITDVSRETMMIDSGIVKHAITKKTKGVAVVHIGGLICPDIEGIRELCADRDLFLIEDAAHAHGSKIRGRLAGSLGLAGCFSLYPTKIITSGEGGIITTNDEELATTAEILRDQGKESFNSNRIVKLGYNWRMPEMCAALGLLQLKRLSEFIDKRNSVAKVYDAEFDKSGIERVVTPADQLNNYYKYTFFLPKGMDRDRFKGLARERGVIYGGEVYWPPLHLQQPFRDFLGKKSRFKTADEWGRRMVSPPMFSQMTKEQTDRVVDITKDLLSKLTN